MSAPHLVTTRRTALGGALVGLVTVAGCDDGPSQDELTTGATTAPAEAADTDLVDEVTSQILAARGVVLEVRSGKPEAAPDAPAARASSWRSSASARRRRRQGGHGLVGGGSARTQPGSGRRRPAGAPADRRRRGSRERRTRRAARLDGCGHRPAPGGAAMTYVAALQTTLAGEHASLYVYGALGAQTSQSGAPTLFAALTDAYDAHRARRDQLTALLTDQGAAAVAAEPAYELPSDLGSVDAVTESGPGARALLRRDVPLPGGEQSARRAPVRGGPAEKHCGPRTRLPRNPRDVPRKGRVSGPLVGLGQRPEGDCGGGIRLFLPRHVVCGIDRLHEIATLTHISCIAQTCSSRPSQRHAQPR